MATHSCRISWTEESGVMQSMESQRVRHDWAINTLDFPGGASGKEPVWQCQRRKRPRFEPWVRKTPWRRAWRPTPVLPGESHGQLSLWATVQGITQRVRQDWSILAHVHRSCPRLKNRISVHTGCVDSDCLVTLQIWSKSKWILSLDKKHATTKMKDPATKTWCSQIHFFFLILF